jgi:predicted nucleic acid-binding protein
MSIFVDTSAVFAVLDADDQNHGRAKQAWVNLIAQGAELVCTSYILVEAFALVQHRLGMEAARVLQDDVAPMLHVEWVDEGTHDAGVAALLTAARRQLSLVDCVSFNVMHRLGIKTAFAFDDDFAKQGFELIPEMSEMS